jgi:hypothetical protein
MMLNGAERSCVAVHMRVCACSAIEKKRVCSLVGRARKESVLQLLVGWW